MTCAVIVDRCTFMEGLRFSPGFPTSCSFDGADVYTQKKVASFFLLQNLTKFSISRRLTILKFLGHVFGRIAQMQLKLLKFGGFRF